MYYYNIPDVYKEDTIKVITVLNSDSILKYTYNWNKNKYVQDSVILETTSSDGKKYNFKCNLKPNFKPNNYKVTYVFSYPSFINNITYEFVNIEDGSTFLDYKLFYVSNFIPENFQHHPKCLVRFGYIFYVLEYGIITYVFTTSLYFVYSKQNEMDIFTIAPKNNILKSIFNNSYERFANYTTTFRVEPGPYKIIRIKDTKIKPSDVIKPKIQDFFSFINLNMNNNILTYITDISQYSFIDKILENIVDISKLEDGKSYDYILIENTNIINEYMFCCIYDFSRKVVYVIYEMKIIHVIYMEFAERYPILYDNNTKSIMFNNYTDYHNMTYINNVLQEF